MFLVLALDLVSVLSHTITIVRFSRICLLAGSVVILLSNDLKRSLWWEIGRSEIKAFSPVLETAAFPMSWVGEFSYLQCVSPVSPASGDLLDSLLQLLAIDQFFHTWALEGFSRCWNATWVSWEHAARCLNWISWHISSCNFRWHLLNSSYSCRLYKLIMDDGNSIILLLSKSQASQMNQLPCCIFKSEICYSSC